MITHDVPAVLTNGTSLVLRCTHHERDALSVAASISVVAYLADGTPVGRAQFVDGSSDSSGPWEARGEPGVEVLEIYRRQGIATAIYRFAHHHLPGGIASTGDLTDDGHELWRSFERFDDDF